MVDRERSEKLTEEYLAEHPPSGAELRGTLCPECADRYDAAPDGGTFLLCARCEAFFQPPLYRCDICGAAYLVGDAAAQCCRNISE